MSIRKRLQSAKSHYHTAPRSKSANPDKQEEMSQEQPVCNANVKVSKANTFSTDKYPAYERVVLQETSFARPVVLFGPLADVAREKLSSESPQRFEIPDSYSPKPSSSTSSGVIKLASIRDIMDKQRHCLLDITPNAVDHLNYAQYFPICIYIKTQSRQQIKELRQKYAASSKTSLPVSRQKSARRLHENAQRLEAFYAHLFTGQVCIESANWFKKLRELIDKQQSEPLWISHDLVQVYITICSYFLNFFFGILLGSTQA
jgi:tight junction protein 1